MEIRRVGWHAALVELASAGQVRAACRRLAGTRGLTELVPGARSVLVVVESEPMPDLAALLADLPDEAAPDGPAVELPVSYDGPDLAEVGELTGLSPEEVVRRHTVAELVVAFCGFAPGFAYLTGLPAQLQVPRRATPRTAVPAGSVGLAGEFTGVYPRRSPGGWQLIGRTDADLWDADRDPPALLAPGTSALRPVLTVLRAGPLTTVQDLGRPGYAHLGVPRSGAVDAPALRRANRLVGNRVTAAGLETTLLGTTFRLEVPRAIAVTGAQAPVTVDGRPVDVRTRVPVAAGAVVRVGTARSGLRSYVAVEGGIAVPPVLGSRSTDRLSGLGPAPLADGDSLPLGEPANLPDPLTIDRRTGPGTLERLADAGYRLLVRPGPRDDRLTPAGWQALASAGWTVSTDSDRVGVRLGGPRLEWARTGELPSEGLVTGAVQVPPDGQPVVFLADHPTTGGYPVVGVVDPSDLSVLAQARPGSTLRFTVE